MASRTSEERTAEKENDGRKNTRITWSPRLIEYEKNKQNRYWGTERLILWRYDEVEMQKWLYENSKKLDDIHNHILHHGDGEEIVWEYDVWGLQQYTEIPPEYRADHDKGKK
ncbi:hypothetical protein ACH5RR_018672 [Cinchona calisaya]|uniref:Uncharacterized protein n=1 Tax=Cinchona calisaya TaxID=153742 RepID=A0ABD2ZND6_9GENT